MRNLLHIFLSMLLNATNYLYICMFDLRKIRYSHITVCVLSIGILLGTARSIRDILSRSIFRSTASCLSMKSTNASSFTVNNYYLFIYTKLEQNLCWIVSHRYRYLTLKWVRRPFATLPNLARTSDIWIFAATRDERKTRNESRFWDLPF